MGIGRAQDEPHRDRQSCRRMWGGGAVPHFIDLLEFYFNEAVIVKIGMHGLASNLQFIRVHCTKFVKL